MAENGSETRSSAGWDPVDRLLFSWLAEPADGFDARLEALRRTDPELAEAVSGRLQRMKRIGWAFDGPAPPVGPAEGQLFGDYRIRSVLGIGGMGAVYLADQESLGRPVALKVIRGDRLPDPRARDRFRREARVVASLRHPAICAVLDVGEVDEQPYLAMQYVDGETLAQQLTARRAAMVAGGGVGTADSRGPPSTQAEIGAAVGALEKVARALHEAHEAGVVHRDVKPGNVMIDSRGEPVVLDFGLARSEADLELDLTRTGDLVGTPAYMSPEQVRPRGRPIDRRTDVFSLGVTMFEWLTLERPFTGSNQAELYERIERDPTPDPRRRNPSLPADAAAVISKAMEKDPARRYQSAAEFADDLARLRRREPVRARRIGHMGRAWRWAQRYPVGASLIAVLAIGVVTTSLLWHVTTRQRDDIALSEQRLTERQAAFGQLAQVVHLERARATLDGMFPAADPAAARARLVAGIEPLRAGLPELRRQLERFRELAPQRTPEEVQADIEGHPSYAQFAMYQQMVASTRAANVLRAEDPAARAADLPFDAATASESELMGFVRQRVGPRPEVPGEGRLALAAAEELFGRLVQGDELEQPSRAMTALAFGLGAYGLTAEQGMIIYGGINAEDADVRAGTAKKVSPELLQHLRDELRRVAAESDTELRRMEARLNALDAEVRERRTWRMRRPEDEFLHRTLSDTVPAIEQFLADDAFLAERWLGWAEREEELTVERFRDRWDDAIAAVRAADGIVAHELYAGSPELVPQRGLVPIGMNPVTHLWEFYDLLSAWDPRSDVDPATLPIPVHDAEGRIELGPGTGIVFVLVPGGTAAIGSQSEDPSKPQFDPLSQRREEFPPHDVRLDWFFLARHELTNAQWRRLAGHVEAEPYPYIGGPRTYGYVPGGRAPPVVTVEIHPLEDETAVTIEGVIGMHGLSLPTSVQWEYACRTGTTTPWFTGDEPDSLEGFANLLDLRSTLRQLTQGQDIESAMFDDGFQMKAPAGMFDANLWGFHDMCGNVAEWCADDHAFYSIQAARPGDGWREMPSLEPLRWRDVRGGSYKDPPSRTRSASRVVAEQETSSGLIGARIARRVTDR